MTKINDILCGIILPITLLGAGVYFAIKLKFFYLFKPIKTLKAMLFSKGGFPSLTVALAGTLGIGNIVGVSSAIIGGGYGSIFWMWVSAFLAMSLKYTEVVLAIRYRKKENGKYHGGAPYYIYEGFKNRLGSRFSFILGASFGVLCALNSLSTGNLVQTNAVSGILPMPKLIFGIIFAFLSFLVVCRGIKRIEKFTSVLMPILSVVYILLCLYVLLTNLRLLPSAFYTIFKEAFSIKSAFYGTLGFGISRAMRLGICRGLLSNEAGCGTSPCAHASSSNESPHAQGCLGVFEVFFDTIVLCTLTALVIIVSVKNIANEPLELVLSAFASSLGGFGRYAVLICCLLFAFATVVTQYFYGVESLKFISKSKKLKLVFSIIFFLVTIFSAVISSYLMWEIADFILAIMTVFNVICLLLLRKEI